jgi:membrane-associated phospholipid phosphatase
LDGWIVALATILAVMPVLAASPAADPVLFWNEQTNLSIQSTAMDPFNATRALALESIAVLDTLRSAKGAPGFLVHLPAPDDISPNLAASAAAHAMLVYLFPARRSALDAVFANDRSAQPTGEKRQRSIAFGEAVARAIVAIRDRDGWNRIAAFEAGTEAGRWRPTPPRFYPPLNPQWASVAPFTLTRPDQFRPPGPPLPGSQAFDGARLHTATIGGANSPVRSADQTLAAHYWSDAIGTYAPAGHWNSIAAGVVKTAKQDTMGQAEIFAELNIAMADAAIAMADAKYTFSGWRPITAIHTGDAAFPARPDWAPLLETPNHPGYISGHSAFSGAAATVLTSILGGKPFRAGSASLPSVSRSFDNFQQAAEEAANSRLWGGIHFKFDNDDGLVAGRAVGAWAMRVFRATAQDRGPVIVLDPKGAAGFAIDNAAPVRYVDAVLDGGARTTVPVGADGRFVLPHCPPGPHALVVTAANAAGQVSTVAATVVGDG